MVIEGYKEKIPNMITRIEKGEKDGQPVYRISFKGLDGEGIIFQDDTSGKFIHTCEKSANGSACSHLALAVAIGDQVDMEVQRTAFTKLPAESLIQKWFGDVEFEDVSEEFDVLTPISTSPSRSSSSSTKAPKTKPTFKSYKRDWKDGWNEIQEYLQNEDIPMRLILQIRDLRKVFCDTVTSTSMAMEPVKPEFPYTGEMLGRSLRHILMGKDLILVGDKGSGKDTLVSTISWIFSLPLYLQTGNADETKDSVVGENTIVQTDKGMEVEFKKTSFATAVEKGGLSHFAELNMLPGDVTSIFHSVLDDNRQLGTQVGNIKRHEGHIFIGSINQGDQYSGVKQLNGALKDRCSILELPYTQEFKSMIEHKTGLTDPHAIEFLEKIKEAIDFLVTTEQQGEESRTVRGYIDAAKYLNTYGVTFETKVEAVEDFIVNKTSNFEEKMAIRDIIRQKAWSDFPMTKEEEEYLNGGL